MIKVTEENSTRVGPVAVAAEASTLGLAPGQWPKLIETTIGNGQPFLFIRQNTSDGELVSVRYFQQFGCTALTVFND